MSLINLNLTDAGWHTSSTGLHHIRGCAYLGNEKLINNALAERLFPATAPSDRWHKTLNELNGFYALVTQSEENLVAAVDHIRSIPLFYGQISGQLFLSDDAEWVRRQVGDAEMDPVARQEFQLTGYVTGQDTLFPNLKQLQAGECLIATGSDDGIKLETQRYYRFLHSEPADYSEPELQEELDSVALASMRRLTDYAGGRQIVVPLSGGYDSRLIVAMLKRLGYSNILTFTYGVPGNKESQYSKRVAEALGLDWHFIEYSNELWLETWQSDARWEYQKWASGWSSLAHIQDWPAVAALRDRNLIENDAVFVPGHAGDFVAGSHIPEEAKPGSTASVRELKEAILTKHYSLAPFRFISTYSQDFWTTKIQSQSELSKIEKGEDLANAFEKWDWQERQAKYIANSVRVYEDFGYDWWMPLWDKEFVEFWENVPLRLRRGRTWYNSFVESFFAFYADILSEPVTGNAEQSGFLHSLAKKILYSVPGGRTTIKALKPILSTNKHPLAFHSIFDKKLIKKGYKFNGLQAYCFLSEMHNDQGTSKKPEFKL